MEEGDIISKEDSDSDVLLPKEQRMDMGVGVGKDSWCWLLCHIGLLSSAGTLGTLAKYCMSLSLTYTHHVNCGWQQNLLYRIMVRIEWYDEGRVPGT